MVRLLARVALTLIGNAIGLLLADALLDRVRLTASGFIIAVVLFTVALLVLQPLMLKIAVRQLPALVGGTALVSTLAALIVTTIVSDGLSIDGFGTWVVAAVIVWLGALLAGVVLPMFLFKSILAERTDGRRPSTTTWG